MKIKRTSIIAAVLAVTVMWIIPVAAAEPNVKDMVSTVLNDSTAPLPTHKGDETLGILKEFPGKIIVGKNTKIAVKIQGGRWDEDEANKVQAVGQMTIPVLLDDAGTAYSIDSSAMNPAEFKSAKFVRWAISISDGKKNKVLVSRYFYSNDLRPISTRSISLDRLTDEYFRPISN